MLYKELRQTLHELQGDPFAVGENREASGYGSGAEPYRDRGYQRVEHEEEKKHFLGKAFKLGDENKSPAEHEKTVGIQ